MRTLSLALAAGLIGCAAASAQSPAPAPRPASAPTAPASPATAPAGAAAAVPAPEADTVPTGVPVPRGYTIGPADVLDIVFWRDKDMSAQVTVRPDGRITLPLMNDIVAIGLTPEQLRTKLEADAARYIQDPNVTIVVKQINSRKVFITGEVAKPGSYPLNGPTSVLQLISMAGGLSEYANEKKIRVLRLEAGQQLSLPFNYKDVAEGKELAQNIELRPGDTVVVP